METNSASPSARRPSRVLILASPLTLGAGVDIYWKRLLASTRNSSFTLEVVSGGTTDSASEFPHLKVFSPSIFKQIRAFKAFLQDNPTDLVITSISQSDIIFGLLVRFTKLPNWIVAIHGQPYPVTGQTNRIKSIAWRLIWSWSVKRAGHFLVVSEAMKSFLPSGGTSTTIYSVAPPPTRSLVLPEGPLRIGFIGRLSPEKDPHLFCQISLKIPEAQFHVFGDGPEIDTYRANFPNIIWHGFTPTKVAFDQIDLLLVTSKSEGIPLVVLEAAANQVPVIAADVGGIHEAIAPDQESLLLIPISERTDITSWVSRINYLRDLQSYQLTSKDQFEFVNEKFGSKAISTLFGDLIETHTRHAR